MYPYLLSYGHLYYPHHLLPWTSNPCQFFLVSLGISLTYCGQSTVLYLGKIVDGTLIAVEEELQLYPCQEHSRPSQYHLWLLLQLPYRGTRLGMAD